ncbi:hypothetical protein RFI_25568 [Reticulomyxa filosa]|uniref:60S ribosomal protein L36 n=1 Tax=Reticulomyxa filosa TaxID=46433 RepID=X6MEF6_RETFI|nr:hypothetical protein RFI_25568 [Reticulomyxa filosa]|eukprot:ETO11807.1 hypothetical protein RFI_25568 [Reticulomyxa filosa]
MLRIFAVETNFFIIKKDKEKNGSHRIKGGGKENKIKTKKKGDDIQTLKKKNYVKPGRKFVSQIIHETVGFAPYEKRIMELIRLDKAKKALKLAKKRVSIFVKEIKEKWSSMFGNFEQLGTHKRAKKKTAALNEYLSEQARLEALRKTQQKVTGATTAQKESS